jgi:hypothetical protein
MVFDLQEKSMLFGICEGRLTAANHGMVNLGVKELDQTFQKNQPARSRCHLEGIHMLRDILLVKR